MLSGPTHALQEFIHRSLGLSVRNIDIDVYDIYIVYALYAEIFKLNLNNV